MNGPQLQDVVDHFLVHSVDIFQAFHFHIPQVCILILYQEDKNVVEVQILDPILEIPAWLHPTL